MPDPLVTIYLPTRGRSELLRRAIRSVERQSYAYWELEVVVDGVDPKTEGALSEFGQDSRIRVTILPRSGGACRARNIAINRARGQFITGLDDDDELRPDHLRSLLSAIQAGTSSFACTTAVHQRNSSNIVRHAFNGSIQLGPLLCENLVGNQVLTKTKYLQDLGGFDPEMPAWQDYDLWVRLCSTYGCGLKIDGRSYIQHLDHDEERISTATRIRDAHQLFISKHKSKLGAQELASLRLLMLANTHEPLTVRQAGEFALQGFPRRTLSALVSNRWPGLRDNWRRLTELGQTLTSTQRH